MKKVLQIFQRDLKRLLRSPAAALVMVGVCILPSLYAWFNIAANMDPYGNTKNVKVAIANCDTGGHTGSMNLNAGGTIVQNLKKNHQLGWDIEKRLVAVRQAFLSCRGRHVGDPPGIR